VSNTKIKLLFFKFLGPFVENGEVEDCTASDPVKPPTAAVQPQGRTPAKSSQPSEAGWFLQVLGGETCAHLYPARFPVRKKEPKKRL
jgi:hypothetical protein